MRFGTFTRLFLAIYLIEAGILLVVGPWTSWWEQNFFAESLPWLSGVMETEATRFLVTSAGIATGVAGVADLRGALRERFARDDRQVADAAPKL